MRINRNSHDLVLCGLLKNVELLRIGMERFIYFAIVGNEALNLIKLTSSSNQIGTLRA